jgi:hypothetical protein
MATCTHPDQIEIIKPPADIAGGEEWSWCVIDELAFVVR